MGTIFLVYYAQGKKLDFLLSSLKRYKLMGVATWMTQLVEIAYAAVGLISVDSLCSVDRSAPRSALGIAVASVTGVAVASVTGVGVASVTGVAFASVTVVAVEYVTGVAVASVTGVAVARVTGVVVASVTGVAAASVTGVAGASVTHSCQLFKRFFNAWDLVLFFTLALYLN